MENDPIIEKSSRVLAGLRQIAENLTTIRADMSDMETAIGGKADAANVYTKAEADARYVTEHQSLEGYAKAADTQAKLTAGRDIAITSDNVIALSEMAKKRLFIDMWKGVNSHVFHPADMPQLTEYDETADIFWVRARGISKYDTALTYEEAVEVYRTQTIYCGNNGTSPFSMGFKATLPPLGTTYVPPREASTETSSALQNRTARRHSDGTFKFILPLNNSSIFDENDIVEVEGVTTADGEPLAGCVTSVDSDGIELIANLKAAGQTASIPDISEGTKVSRVNSTGYTAGATVAGCAFGTGSDVEVMHLGHASVDNDNRFIVFVDGASEFILSRMPNLKAIVGNIQMATPPFSGNVSASGYSLSVHDCPALEHLTVGNVTSVDLSGAPKISLDSVRYLLAHAHPLAPYSTKYNKWVFHTDVFAKLIDEANDEWHSVYADAIAKGFIIESAATE